MSHINSVSSLCDFSGCALSCICCAKRSERCSHEYDLASPWRCTCDLSLSARLNFFRQMWHVNQVPSFCDLSRCDLRWQSREKLFEQCLHEYSFAKAWVRTWHFRWQLVLNSFPQYQHLKVPSVCEYVFGPPRQRPMCDLRWSLRANFFWQTSHVNQVPSLCDLSKCDLRWWSREKLFEQCLHENSFAPVWV